MLINRQFDHLLSFLPIPLLPEYRCLGFLVDTTLSASPTLIECLNFALIFFASLMCSSG